MHRKRPPGTDCAAGVSLFDTDARFLARVWRKMTPIPHHFIEASLAYHLSEGNLYTLYLCA
jgi:hypothetical protein